MPNARRLTAVVLASLLGAGHWVRAAQDPPTFETAVDVIAVDASVVDRDGRPVRDLKVDEFAVKVDGRTRRVLSIDFVDLGTRPAATTEGVATAAAAPSPAVPPTGRPEGRRIVIAVDRGQIGGGAHQAASAARGLLDQMGPADRMAVFSLPSGPRLDFSADRAAIEKTLDAIGPLRESMVNGEFSISYTEALAYATGRSRGLESPILQRECSKYLSHPGPDALEACSLRVEAEARRLVNDQEASVRDRLNALEALCQALAVVPGPKQLVLVSGGFTRAFTGRDPVGPQLRRIANVAAAASVNIYSVFFSQRFAAMDVSRARENETAEEDRRTLSAGLEQLTGMAGGTLFEAVAGARFAFERVALETSGHYLLSLEPGRHDRDGKPHDIEVKVARPGVHVRSRQQFVMPASGAPVKRARPVAPPAPASPLRIATSVLRGDAEGQIKVVMAAQADGFKDGRFDIQVLDPGGAVVGTAGASAAADAPPVRHQETLLLPRGVYRLKANVVDTAGRKAAVEQALNAELGHGVGFDVSDLMLLEWVEGKMRVPSDRPLAGEKLGVYLELYVQEELPTDRLAVTLELVGADRKRRSATALALEKDEASGLVSAEGEIDAFTLPPGAYVARAIVTFGTRTVRRIERAFVFEGRHAAAPAVTSN
ncbi:MAG: VWA domain-containing protein [Vicinamibacteria bacterium]